MAWERRIWDALVHYANSGEVAAFSKIVNAGMDWIGGPTEDGDVGDLEVCRDYQTDSSLASLGTRYLPEVRNLLTWLSSPAQKDGDSTIRAVDFLDSHGTGKAVKMALTANTEHTDGEGRSLIFVWPDDLKSVLSPVCRFILDQIVRHDTGGERLRDVIPIGLCDRPGCGKFRVMRLVREDKHFFCSSLCRATFGQSNKTKEEKRDYARQNRVTQDRYKPKRVVKGKGR